jgi:hypothetical protein
VTGQGAVGGGAGQADVDGGTTTLVSPNFTLAGANDPRVEFWAWYSNEGGSSPYSDRMPVELSADGGATWVTALTIWENARAWVRREIRVEDFFPAPVAQVRVRFRASDLGSGSLVEAAIDDVRITTATVGCEPLTPADLNSDGVVDGADLGILLGNWGSAGAGDLDGSGTVDGIDLGLLLGSWS